MHAVAWDEAQVAAGDFGGGDPVPKIFYVSAWHGQESKKKGSEFESICSCLGVVDSFLYIYF